MLSAGMTFRSCLGAMEQALRSRLSTPSWPGLRSCLLRLGCETIFELQMRVALVPIEAVRASGFDVRVARFAPSPDVSYTMFTGGGLAWAEQQMKAGQFALTLAGPETRPDLSGLSRRFSEIKSERGVVLSLIILPRAEGDPAAFD